MSRRVNKLNRSRRRYWLALCMCAVAIPAAAAPICGPREKVTQELTKRYGEVPQVMGLNNSGVMEVWASESGGWTVTITRPDGVMCVLGAGHAFERMPPAYGEPI